MFLIGDVTIWQRLKHDIRCWHFCWLLAIDDGSLVGCADGRCVAARLDCSTSCRDPLFGPLSGLLSEAVRPWQIIPRFFRLLLIVQETADSKSVWISRLHTSSREKRCDADVPTRRGYRYSGNVSTRVMFMVNFNSYYVFRILWFI